MYDLQRAFDLSRGLVLKKTKHGDYDRTQTLSRQYKAFATGEDLEYMLRRFDRLESEEDFEMVNRIAIQITKPIVSTLMNPARKVSGVRPVIDRVDYGKQDEKSSLLRDELSEWYGGKSVSEYMATLIDPSDMDPNAFALLTFDQFDYRKTKPTVFPVIIPSANVWGFQYLNGALAYLFLAFDIKYVTKPASTDLSGKVTPAETADGMRFVLYTAEHHIVFEQVAKETMATGPKEVLIDASGNAVELAGNKGVQFTDAGGEAVYFLRNEGDIVYSLRFYEQKSGRVPAFRLGCKPDALTEGRTCVNRWDEAVPYLKKLLKQIREVDLSTINHAIPQRIQYVGPCKAKDCNNGRLPGGQDACSVCGGSGEDTIKSASQHITIRRPKNPADPMFDLEKLVHYVRNPSDGIMVLYNIMKETRSDCTKAVYGSDLYSQGNVGKTYEEVAAMNQGMYDALKPLADWWSDAYMTINHVYASYNDKGKDLVVILKMPRSFGFETAATAFAAIKAAKEAGASTTITANLNSTAIEILFRDDSDALQRVKVQESFNPYPGKDEATVLSLISGGQANERSAILWTESATVFRLAEEKYPGDVTFYDLTEKKQREVINAIVDDLLKEKDERAAEKAPQFAGVTGMDPDPSADDPNADPNADPPQELRAA